MKTKRFWEIIGDVNSRSGGDMDTKTRFLTERLQSMDSSEILSFVLIFDSMMAKAYTWGLWNAAEIIHKYCGDDGFGDFRGTLISMGKNVFNRAVRAPDTLADIDHIDVVIPLYEAYRYVAFTLYEEKTGTYPGGYIDIGNTPSGNPCNDEAFLQEQYPRLWKKCIG